ncbi:MAG: hypothetical protein HY700_10805 [Gemmatimonadetes bacterium]|nr:hypothetical protein [Gemmatimonadota bacterium]
MPEFGLDERVARLEGRVDGFADRFDGLDQRMNQLDGRMDRFERRMDALDAKVDRFREELAGQIRALDQKVSTQFRWTVGIQVAVLLAVVAALAGR